MDSSLEFRERKYRIHSRTGSDKISRLYHKKEEPVMRRDKSGTMSRKNYSSSVERDKKHRLARLTIISSDSSLVSNSAKVGGSQGSIHRKTLETYGKYFLRSRSNQVKSRKIAQTSRDNIRRSNKKYSSKSKSADRKRPKSVTSKKRKNKSLEAKKSSKNKPPKAAMNTLQPKLRTIESQKMKTLEPKKMKTIQQPYRSSSRQNKEKSPKSRKNE